MERHILQDPTNLSKLSERIDQTVLNPHIYTNYRRELSSLKGQHFEIIVLKYLHLTLVSRVNGKQHPLS